VGQFGLTVGIDGNTALVGDPIGNAAYVYALSAGTWTLQGTLSPSDSTSQFGTAVAVSGGTAVVGTGTSAAGYLYTQLASSGHEQQKLIEMGGTSGDQFGFGVAIGGPTAVFGAPGTSTITGAAYVFTNTATAAAAPALGSWTPMLVLLLIVAGVLAMRRRVVQGSA
jgi:hypothetical protein